MLLQREAWQNTLAPFRVHTPWLRGGSEMVLWLIVTGCHCKDLTVDSGSQGSLKQVLMLSAAVVTPLKLEPAGLHFVSQLSWMALQYSVKHFLVMLPPETQICTVYSASFVCSHKQLQMVLFSQPVLHRQYPNTLLRHQHHRPHVYVHQAIHCLQPVL